MSTNYPQLAVTYALFYFQHVVVVLVAKSCLTLLRPHGLYPPKAPLSMEFSRQEYWSGLPFPSPGHLPDSGIKPKSSALAANSLRP